MEPGSLQEKNFLRYWVIGRNMENVGAVEVLNGVLVRSNRSDSKALAVIDKKN